MEKAPSAAPGNAPGTALCDARTRAGTVPGRPATAQPGLRPAAPPPVGTWLTRIRPRPPAPIPAAALWSALATAVLSALLLGDGLGLNLLIVAVPATLTAYFAAIAAGRRPRPWTVVWGLGGLALLVVPALRDAGWPTFLAVVSAVGLASLALHGSRNWRGILFSPIGLVDSIGPGLVWAWRGLRQRTGGAQGRVGPVLRTIGVAVGLLIVFGALFAGADAAFADLLGSLTPDVSVTDGPWRSLLFALGLVGALAAARTAAAPLRWDRLKARPGRPRARLEWALPLIVLNLLFAVFNAVQLAVLFGGYKKVLSQTGFTYAEYARQGFWQLLWATLLTLAVIALALRWAPRDGARDRTLVRSVLGTLCLLTLVVVASALRRMDLYVDAYGLTRLRVSVAAMELWLGLVIVLIMAAGVLGARRLHLPRAVAVSAAAGVLTFGLVSPDGLVAERNVQRYERTGKIDIGYLDGLSADAVPALDRLPEPLRSCALVNIARNLDADETPWYAVSRGETRAQDILDKRGVPVTGYSCTPQRNGYDDEFDEHDY
ncbi:DUF4173 domain-containing protein [Streptomyces sp. CB03238]|uniref:DUF4153 domain-containing protein n=1 Tax=Streptomyces sp. CB03238 TaxID=1907777 RepID=UPI000A1205B6|nr:DUF4173 domain-containing protein [Streptomyces sp. CB03238]ORT55052.1 hypothetical protein BKD26_33555 [Streptomyces sp. CB03238]